MKKFLCLILALSSIFVFTLFGCTNDKSKPISQNALIDYSNDMQITYLCSGGGSSIPATKSDTGYYYIGDDRIIIYIDSKTQKATPLCAKPDCMHNDPDTCDAYVNSSENISQDSLWGSLGTAIQYYQGYLYMVCGEYDKSMIEYNTYLMKMDKDGTNRQKVTDYFDSPFTNWFIHQGYFYYTSDSSVLRIPLTNPKSSPEEVYKAQHFIKDNENTYSSFCAYKNYIYFQVDELDEEGNGIGRQTICLNLDTMKKSFLKKVLAAAMAVLMISSCVPLSALAANELSLGNENALNTSYYSNVLSNGDDFIATIFEGVDKNKTVTITKGDTATIKVNSGKEDTSTNTGKMTWSNLSTGLWHYGNNTDYALGTDQPWSMTSSGGNVSIASSGFGSSAKEGENMNKATQGKDTITTYTIDTSNAMPGRYTLTLNWRYQFKKYERKNIFSSYYWFNKKTYENNPITFTLVITEQQADFAALKSELETSKSIVDNNSSLYTTSSYAAFKSAYDTANDFYNTNYGNYPASNQSNVDAQKDALAQARANLIYKADLSSINAFLAENKDLYENGLAKNEYTYSSTLAFQTSYKTLADFYNAISDKDDYSKADLDNNLGTKLKDAQDAKAALAAVANYEAYNAIVEAVKQQDMNRSLKAISRAIAPYTA